MRVSSACGSSKAFQHSLCLCVLIARLMHIICHGLKCTLICQHSSWRFPDCRYTGHADRLNTAQHSTPPSEGICLDCRTRIHARLRQLVCRWRHRRLGSFRKAVIHRQVQMQFKVMAAEARVWQDNRNKAVADGGRRAERRNLGSQ